MMEYEPFCIYGFSTVCPINWSIVIDPSLERSEGCITFKSVNNSNIVVSWKSLEKTQNKYSTLKEHVEESIDRIKKEKRVKTVQLIKTKNMQVNSHDAIFSHIRMTFSMPKLLPFRTRTHDQYVYSLHLYCEQTNRCFIIYGVTKSDKSSELDRAFKKVIGFFACHNVNAHIDSHTLSSRESIGWEEKDAKRDNDISSKRKHSAHK